MNSLSVRGRLFLGFGCVFVALLIIVALAISRVNSINETLALIVDENAQKQRQAIHFR